jgi:predicted RNase H-like HicB family nuclease
VSKKFFKQWRELTDMVTTFILSDYIKQVIDLAGVESLEDNTFFARIPACPGVIAFGNIPELCRQELCSTLEDWILLGLKVSHPLPILNGIDLNQEPAREPMDFM